jgi:type IV pilus assembly protein PilA
MTILVTRGGLEEQSGEPMALAGREEPMARSSLDVSRPVRKLTTRDRSGARRALDRGFTLVEMMITVVIVGVLAVLAVVGFQKLIGSARMTEATAMVQSIKGAQEAFHAETGTYADISPALCTGATNCQYLYPQGVTGALPVSDRKTGWGVAGLGTAVCNAGMDWLMLPVHTTGGVEYGYTTIAGLASSSAPLSSIGSASLPTKLGPTGGSQVEITLGFANGVPTDWYAITATGDEDADGVPCNVMATSFSSDLIVSGEGN